MHKIAIGLAAVALATGAPTFAANASNAASGINTAVQSGDEARVELAHYYGRGYGRGYYGHRYYRYPYYGYYGHRYPYYGRYYGRHFHGRH